MYNRDGFMRMDNSGTGASNYEPNSFGGPKEAPQYTEHAYDLQGRADRYNHREGNDDYTQAGDLFRLMPKDAQQRLISKHRRQPEERDQKGNPALADLALLQGGSGVWSRRRRRAGN